MKTPALLVVAASLVTLHAEDPGIKQRIQNAAERTGEFIGNAVEKTKEGVQTAVEKTKEAGRTVGREVTDETETGTHKITTETRSIADRVSDRVEHPITPEQRSRIDAAEADAKAKLAAAREELAQRVSEISGVAREKVRRWADDL